VRETHAANVPLLVLEVLFSQFIHDSRATLLSPSKSSLFRPPRFYLSLQLRQFDPGPTSCSYFDSSLSLSYFHSYTKFINHTTTDITSSTMLPISPFIAYPMISQLIQEDIHVLSSEIRLFKSELRILKSENSAISKAINHISMLLSQAKQRTTAIDSFVASIEEKKKEKAELARKKMELEAQKEELIITVKRYDPPSSGTGRRVGITSRYSNDLIGHIQ
jgi:hypothetical protein